VFGVLVHRNNKPEVLLLVQTEQDPEVRLLVQVKALPEEDERTGPIKYGGEEERGEEEVETADHNRP
jgi:hypothetical protein